MTLMSEHLAKLLEVMYNPWNSFWLSSLSVVFCLKAQITPALGGEVCAPEEASALTSASAGGAREYEWLGHVGVQEKPATKI